MKQKIMNDSTLKRYVILNKNLKKIHKSESGEIYAFQKKSNAIELKESLNAKGDPNWIIGKIQLDTDNTFNGKPIKTVDDKYKSSKQYIIFNKKSRSEKDVIKEKIKSFKEKTKSHKNDTIIQQLKESLNDRIYSTHYGEICVFKSFDDASKIREILMRHSDKWLCFYDKKWIIQEVELDSENQYLNHPVDYKKANNNEMLLVKRKVFYKNFVKYGVLFSVFFIICSILSYGLNTSTKDISTSSSSYRVFDEMRSIRKEFEGRGFDSLAYDAKIAEKQLKKRWLDSPMTITNSNEIARYSKYFGWISFFSFIIFAYLTVHSSNKFNEIITRDDDSTLT